MVVIRVAAKCRACRRAGGSRVESSRGNAFFETSTFATIIEAEGGREHWNETQENGEISRQNA